MKNITKNTEPRTLTQHRCQTNADYDNYPHHQDLRDSLTSEQGCICAYCMQRIEPNPNKMKIEHWHCQYRYQGEQLDYSNLLGVCKGSEGKPKNMQHCDTSKGSIDILFNPANPAHDIERTISYTRNGKIKSSNPDFDKELNDVLNLNRPILMQNRAGVLEGYQMGLEKHGPLTKTFIQRQIAEWNNPQGGILREYCMVVISWLRNHHAGK